MELKEYYIKVWASKEVNDLMLCSYEGLNFHAANKDLFTLEDIAKLHQFTPNGHESCQREIEHFKKKFTELAKEYERLRQNCIPYSSNISEINIKYK